jgi:carboxypeptidase T
VTRHHVLSRLGAVPIAMLAVAVLASPAAAADPAEFPAGWEGFHTYAELNREVSTIAAAHTNIVKRFSIGKSYQGRDIWAVKVSDNVNVDENEPEVLFDGLHHAREHMTTEMTLAIFKWLVSGYGRDTTITRLVNTREIWIVFIVNPDGQLYDISGGKYRLWRKNRQPTPGSSYIGTDVNRNYPYRWGCCGGSSTNPASLMYRGWKPLSAPESTAVYNFVNSRVIGGRQQIRTAITFHTSGRLVMWPYGYTYANLPSDMTYADYRTFVAMGRAMAATNGYKPEQASDLYISSGTTRDWEYGAHRIFAFTFELTVGWYADDSTIVSETTRNKKAVLYLIDMAGCPQRAIGGMQLYCGPLFDDLELWHGWTVNPSGSDTAISGAWQRTAPQPTSFFGPKQLRAASGARALVTGGAAGSSAWANDLDGGVTSVRSPEITLPAGQSFGFRMRSYFAHTASATSADFLRVSVVGDTTAVLFEQRATAVDRDAAWTTWYRAVPAAFAGQTVRLLIEASGGAGLVEAGVDDIAIIRL